MKTLAVYFIGVGAGLLIALAVTSNSQAGQEKAEQAVTRPVDLAGGLQAPSAECRKKLEALREDVLREACRLIDEQVQYLESKLEILCEQAGEQIYRTVDNVEGIYIQIPDKDPDKAFRYYHEDDRYDHRYVSPTMGKHYRFWEMDSFRKPGVIDHRELEIDISSNGRPYFNQISDELSQPKAEYGIVWKPLTSSEEERQGLYGDESTIFDVKSKRILATRRMYYYLVGNNTATTSGRYIAVPGSVRVQYFSTCKNYSPGQDESYTDKRPRHSYKFVSSVLRPKPMAPEIAIHVFDLAKGSGNKKRNIIYSGCSTLGPDIKPEDIELSRVTSSGLRIAIKGTNDVLTCKGYFHPATFNPETQGLRFYDGSKLKGDEILKRASIPAPVEEPGKVERQAPVRSQDPVEVARPPRTPDRCSFADVTLPGKYFIYAAGGHLGRALNFQIDQSGAQANQIDVTVNSVLNPVVLFLGSYNPTIWNIRWTSGTNILAVVASGYHRQAVAGLPKDAPVLISTYDNKGPCGYFLVSGESSGGPNALSRRLFGRSVDHVFLAEAGAVVVGDPIGKDTRLETSPHTPPESYFDSTAPLAGPAGLEDAARQGLIRKATEADVDAWVSVLMEARRNRDIPPTAGKRQPTPHRPSVFRAYVVQKEFVYPAALYGGNSATFFIPKGVPIPIGDPGHSTVYDFNTLRCQGVLCGR